MNNSSKILIPTLILSTLVVSGFCLTCYSSNGQSRDQNDDGQEYECRPASKATARYCLKFMTSSRPGKVFRECDHIYEHLFGYETFWNKSPGCHRFTANVNGLAESGAYCFCPENMCNGGPINDADIVS